MHTSMLSVCICDTVYTLTHGEPEPSQLPVYYQYTSALVSAAELLGLSSPATRACAYTLDRPLLGSYSQ